MNAPRICIIAQKSGVVERPVIRRLPLKNMMTANVSDPVGYVGIIVEKNGSLEHIVVLLDKPVCRLTSEEEELVYDCCGKVWPEIAAIRAEEITPVYDDKEAAKAMETFIRAKYPETEIVEFMNESAHLGKMYGDYKEKE